MSQGSGLDLWHRVETQNEKWEFAEGGTAYEESDLGCST